MGRPMTTAAHNDGPHQDARRAGLPEGWQAWRAKVCGRELFIFAPDGAVYGLGETGGER